MKKIVFLLILVLTVFAVHVSPFTASPAFAGMFPPLEGEYGVDVWKFEVFTRCNTSGGLFDGICYNDDADTVKVFTTDTDKSKLVVSADKDGKWSRVDAGGKVLEAGTFMIKNGYHMLATDGREVALIYFHGGEFYLPGGKVLHLYLKPILKNVVQDPCAFSPKPAWCR